MGVPDFGLPDNLGEFASDVESVRNRMNGTGSMVDRYEDDLGDSRVKNALESFVDNWKDGRAEIDGQLEAVKDITDLVVETIRDLETDLESGLQGDGGGGGGQQAV
ncbi:MULTISPECIES: hypothetical protein [Streptomyces]|uniref:hypothetical protein n=1 Tax=Streptomyces TaxID=1883 RepID=UPI000CD583F1|nr:MULTISPECIES: hypothetical protein [Streptomyces]